MRLQSFYGQTDTRIINWCVCVGDDGKGSSERNSIPTHISIYQILEGGTCVVLKNGIYCFPNVTKGKKA